MANGNPKDQWTLRKGLCPGEKWALCRHLVELVEVVRHEPEYDVWKVRVLGPITMNADGSERSEVVPPFDVRGAALRHRGSVYAAAGTSGIQVVNLRRTTKNSISFAIDWRQD